MSIYVVRAFVQLRGALAAETELTRRVTKLERGHETHGSLEANRSTQARTRMLVAHRPVSARTCRARNESRLFANA